MTLEAVLVGPAHVVGQAWSRRERWAGSGPSVGATVIIGAGEAPLPVLARAPIWNALDLSGVGAAHLILAEPPPDGSAARAVLERAGESRMKTWVIEDDAMRRLQIGDLLGHPLGAVDWRRIAAMVEGKSILITGGGGSIGGELARRIAELGPRRLTLLDCSEHNLYMAGLELRDASLVLADVRDAASMRRWLASARPDLVFHAAALKQVPLVEQFPSEGVLTNVCGLRNVADAARAVGADLVFVSTDKAVEPSGAMGATKRLGEFYCHALDRRGGGRAIAVRLGNVLGSAGSVLPIFEAQLAAGGPLTVTDPHATRFFMSIPQAADALLHAAAVGIAAPARGATLVIDMAEALPVVDLARDIIRLEGLRPGQDVAIRFTGLRPGEKLHEVLVGSDEWREGDPASGVIAAASAPRTLTDLREAMERLARLAQDGQDAEVAAGLFEAVAQAQESDRAATA